MLRGRSHLVALVDWRRCREQQLLWMPPDPPWSDQFTSFQARKVRRARGRETRQCVRHAWRTFTFMSGWADPWGRMRRRAADVTADPRACGPCREGPAGRQLPQPSRVHAAAAAEMTIQDGEEIQARLTEAQVGFRLSVVGAGITDACCASSARFHDAKMRARSIASGQKPADLAIERRQASLPFPRKREKVRVGHLAMPGDPQAVAKRCRHAIDVVGPGFVAVHGCDVPQQGERLGRRYSVGRELWIGRQADEPELGQRAGRPARRSFPFEPCVRNVMVDVRRPCKGEQQVEIEQEGQGSSSCFLTRSRVRTVPA